MINNILELFDAGIIDKKECFELIVRENNREGNREEKLMQEVYKELDKTWGNY